MAITTGMSNNNGMHCVQFNDNGNILFNVGVYGILLNLQRFDELPIQCINKAFLFIYLF